MQQYETDQIRKSKTSSEQGSNKQEQPFQDLSLQQPTIKASQFVQQATVSIKLKDYYVVIPCSQAEVTYTQKQEWNDLLGRSYQERQANMSVMGLHSVIGVSEKQADVREMIWSSILQQIGYKEQGEGKQKNQAEADTNIVEQIQSMVEKMVKRMGIKDENQSYFIKMLISHMILDYEAKEQHLGSLKGLQYICYGIYTTSPFKKPPQISLIFQYLMQTQNLKQIFYHGSPLFYLQLPLLTQQLKNEAPALYTHLEANQADWPKIFIAYYRTLLLNRLKNQVLVRKILQLVLVYGVCVIRMLLVRIIAEKEEEFMGVKDPEELMSILATNLIPLYFEDQDKNESKQEVETEAEEKVIAKMRKLLIGI